MTVFGYDYFEDHYGKEKSKEIKLLSYEGLWGSGGEYAYESADFRALMPVLDVVQADATRCGGITGFLDAHALIAAHELPMSTHCAPAVHVALGCALPAVRHIEWFFDHQRIERLLFDGAPQPERGRLRPDLSRPGLGLTLKREAVEKTALAI